MKRIDWDNVQEANGYDNPSPGAYIAVICSVEDNEQKEYLRISWDFAEGEFKGNNRETYDRAGFWPIQLIRSYKPKALGFFKAFKTALEESNPGFRFDEFNLSAMVGKRLCVVLGEEEYQGNDGSIKTRLYVYQTRSLDAYRKGDFKVPDMKRLNDGSKPPAQSWNPVSSLSSASSVPDSFSDLSDDDEELPF